MTQQIVENIVLLRVVVGYLGEKDQYGRWQSSFFTQGSDTFLSPLFTRTKILAQCNGVTQAAALVHDDRIGIGHVYHLFRLPEDMEQSIHQALHDISLGNSITRAISNKSTALDYLTNQSIELKDVGIGPIHIGSTSDLRDKNSWQKVAAIYHSGFLKNKEIFPYFADNS